ncbi:hypothetical protein RhiirA5_442007 [Rhizophagus irregularis]|uniref:Uncharacterized protein n=1 Tax=Rhizophagus irregularis TaxID=588596 RepID=A0A2I1DXJ0_9GLOM|nr:hypothetical protein RhiirA5_442007 [Rhizophagus irregularis]PKC70366.1 hypothetical protein RhiirA1_454886 [Rhizophagus irregularis]PKY14591.1 hypothetical protein RhiirB3_426609 [Rhizophagus irregularis]
MIGKVIKACPLCLRNGIYQNINDEIEEKELEIEDDNNDSDLVDIEKYEKFNSENDNVLQKPQVITIEFVNIDNVIDHGNKNFDLDKLLNKQFNVDNE